MTMLCMHIAKFGSMYEIIFVNETRERAHDFFRVFSFLEYRSKVMRRFCTMSLFTKRI